MQHRLIDELCDAIVKWSETTARPPDELTFHAMMQLGGWWYVRPEGALSNPRSPEHKNKTVGEVLGKYTIEQVRDFLIQMVDRQKIWEGFLVPALIESLERVLLELTMEYEESIQRDKEEAAWLQSLYDHPEQNEDAWKIVRKSLSRGSGEQRDPRQTVLEVANLLWKISNRGPDDLAQRQSWLAAWRNLTAPIIARENLREWGKEYFDTFWSKDD